MRVNRVLANLSLSLHDGVEIHTVSNGLISTIEKRRNSRYLISKKSTMAVPSSSVPRIRKR